LVKYGITIDEVRQAVESSNQNATGGYLNQRPNELLVRAIGRIQTLEDLKNIAVAHSNTRPVALSMIAEVVEAPQAKRGDAAAFVREPDGNFSGGSAVVLTISKQPGADTRAITREIEKAIAEIQPSLSAGIRIEPLYAQEHFIDRAIENVLAASWWWSFCFCF
jgi:HME family heavy-metal exporter